MANPMSREKSGLLGAVRRVRTDVAQFVRERGRLIQKPWYHSIVRYDARGNPTEQVTHNADGTAVRTIYVYDGEGRPGEARHEADGAANGRTVYLYDPAGRLSYELSLRADGSEASQTRRFYEADGSYTEEFTGDAVVSDERASFIRTRRDAAGQPLEMRFYEASGGLRYRFVYHYNGKGILTDMEQRTGDQPPCALPAGTELAGAALADFAALFSPDTAISTARYRYDEQGRRTEAATWMGANCIDRRTFAYNDRGEKSAEMRYGAEGKLLSNTRYEREYDPQGNWILERVLEGGQPVSVTRRTIEYE